MSLADSIPTRVRPSASKVGLSSSIRQSAVLVTGLVILLGGLVISTAVGAVFIYPSEILNAIVGDADRVPVRLFGISVFHGRWSVRWWE